MKKDNSNKNKENTTMNENKEENIINKIDLFFLEITNINCNIDYNMNFSSEKKFLIEIINKADPYFYKENDDGFEKTENKEECFFSLTNDPIYKVNETNLSGQIKYNNNPDLIFKSKKVLEYTNKTDYKINYKINPQEIKCFLIEIN